MLRYETQNGSGWHSPRTRADGEQMAQVTGASNGANSDRAPPKHDQLTALRSSADAMMRSNTARFRVCVISVPTLPFNHIATLDHFVRLLMPSCQKIFLITGKDFPYQYDNRVVVTRVNPHKNGSPLDQIAGKVIEQIADAIHLIRLAHNFSIVLFHFNPHHNQLPIICAKALKKRIVVCHIGGNYILEQKLSPTSGAKRILCSAAACLSRFSYLMANVITCEGGEYLMRWSQLEKYERKLVWFVHYVDIDRFSIVKPQDGRSDVIGYFGRLDNKKGVLNLIRAMPLILKERGDVRFVIAGPGPLRGAVEREIKLLDINDKVDVVGFIEEIQVPKILTQWRLLALPSYEEGVPVVIMQAMACGTPVAVTPVGGIPDLVRDNYEAFIIYDNTPEGIARTVLRALQSRNLERIAARGRHLIEKTYGFEQMVVRYRAMLEKADQETKGISLWQEHTNQCRIYGDCK